MDNLDINVLVQTFNEKIAQLTTESVIKDATIKQLLLKVDELSALATTSKQEDKNKVQKDDFK
jgi:hypothetical protein